jgi:hypothetical protein
MPSPEYEVPLADRTVGQLIAEAIRLYQRRFWRALALGVGPTAFTVGAAAFDGAAQLAYGTVVGPVVLSATYVLAVRLATGARASVGLAFLAGIVAFIPLAVSRVFIFPGIYFVALGWFALLGLSVPSILVEGRSLVGGFRQGIQLARADFVHAFGAVAAIAILVVVSIFSLSLFLAGFGDQSVTIAAVLAVVVMSPLFFLVSALLYLDQKARLESGHQRRRRRDARLHHADEPDRARRPDAQVEPGSSARGEP